MLLRDARIGGRVVDVLIRDGVVAAVAPGLAPEGGEVVPLEGRTVIRGLRDEHVHVTQAALAGLWTPLGGAASAGAALERMTRALERATPDEVVVGIGYQDGTWPDRASGTAIDALAGGRAVVLISHDVHAVWLSAAAARRFGVTREDGVVREAPAFAVGAAVNALAAARTEAAVADLLRRASALGVTSITDFEMAWSRDAWRQRMAGEWFGPRIAAAVYPADLDRAAVLGLGTGASVDSTRGLLTVGPLKTLIDGALNTRTAYCVDPYPDGTRGLLTVPPAALRDLLRRARAAALVPAVHAIGDAAVTVALDAFASAGVRGRIEHAQLVADADVPRFAELGVAASVQPAHLLDDRTVAEVQWPDRTGRAYPFRSLVAAGTTLLFGSDAPVAPLDPWRAIRAAVDRSLPGDAPWHPEQRIGLVAALDASTGGRPVPAVGDPADLAALDDPPEVRLPDRVALTLVAGEATHRAL